METPRRGGGGSPGRKSDIAVPPPLVPQHELSRTEPVSRHLISCLVCKQDMVYYRIFLELKILFLYFCRESLFISNLNFFTILEFVQTR